MKKILILILQNVLKKIEKKHKKLLIVHGTRYTNKPLDKLVFVH